jgi:hypothetical protein
MENDNEPHGSEASPTDASTIDRSRISDHGFDRHSLLMIGRSVATVAPCLNNN